MKSFTSSDEPPLFIDTWGWIALADRRESAHEEVQSLRRRYSKRLAGWVTSDYVLDETFTRVFSRRPFQDARDFCDRLFRARDSGLLRIEAITPSRFREAYRLRIQLQDKATISFTDLTSMCLMQELGLVHVVTQDSHFLQVGLGFEILP